MAQPRVQSRDAETDSQHPGVFDYNSPDSFNLPTVECELQTLLQKLSGLLYKNMLGQFKFCS